MNVIRVDKKPLKWICKVTWLGSDTPASASWLALQIIIRRKQQQIIQRALQNCMWIFPSYYYYITLKLLVASGMSGTGAYPVFACGQRVSFTSRFKLWTPWSEDRTLSLNFNSVWTLTFNSKAKSVSGRLLQQLCFASHMSNSERTVQIQFCL